MALTQGDIAFTSFNADEDGWSFVAFVDIDPNTTLYFTDNEAIGSTSFNTGESYFQWVSGSNTISAGTVIRFTAVDAVTLAASVGTLSRATVSGSANYGLAAGGDVVYAFLGTSAAAPTTILTALSTGDVVTPGDPITNAGLTVGVNAIVLRTSADYGEYSGSRTGQSSFANYKTSVLNVANWTVDQTDGVYATTVPNTTNFTASSPTPTVVIAAQDPDAAEAGQDSGTFRITRTGNTTNALAVAYTASGTASTGDFTPALAGTATIAAGQSFVDVTITPVDDVIGEGSETVTLTLVDAAEYDLGAATTATVAIADNDTVPFSSIDLSTYVRIGRYDLPEPTRTAAPTNSLLAQEVSAVTYNPDTDTLFVVGDGSTSIVQVTKTGQLIDSMTLALGSSPQGTDFYDVEGLTYVGGGKFVLIEERDRQASLFTYVPGSTLTKSSVQTVKLGTTVGNIGIEGISYDPQTNGFIAVKETQPEGIFQTVIDFAAGTATNGSPTTANSTNLFDPALANLSDFADVYALSNLPALNGQADSSNLLVLSQESGKIVNIDRTGKIFSSLTIVSDAGNPLSVADQQHEGLTVDNNGILYIVSENGGGDINRPQLWVYAPSSVSTVNKAPTAVVLNSPISTIAENTNTANPIKVADIAIVDDGLGTNNLTVTGVDANFFEITGSGLFLKAGTVLNKSAKASYSITVNVDDPTLGSMPDASVPFTIGVDVVSAVPGLIISEITPWSSGNSPYAADWFEVTNTGTNAVDITGWKIDDNSNAFASAVALRGVTSIPAGKSAVFIEGLTDGSTDATLTANFSTAWFGTTTPPSGFLIGAYGGSGVGLSTAGDAVNLFDASGNRVTGVSFGPSTTGSTFDNTVGLGSTSLPLPTVSTLSAVGVNGAFLASDGIETGSPGTTVNPPTVSIAATDATAAELSSVNTLNTGTFTVTRTGDTAAALTVTYTIGGTATNTNDYSRLTGSVVIPAGQTSAMIAITPVNDALPESSETVILTLTDSASYDLGAVSSATVTIADNAAAPLKKVGGFTSANGAEIPAFDAVSDRLFVVAGSTVEVYSVSNVGALTLAGALAPGFDAPAGTEILPNSVAVKNGTVAVAYAIRETALGTQQIGKVAFFNAADGSFINAVDVGALPDMLTFTPDGTKVLVANEGEPNENYTNDPEGSISIINLSGGVASLTQSNVTTADFSAFNSQKQALMAQGVRIVKPDATVAQDFEPEYIAVSGDGLTARITLQENNAVAVLDLQTGQITAIQPLGLKDYSLPGNGLDAGDRDGAGNTTLLSIRNQPVFGMYQPDAIASYTFNSQTYYITANEGDSRVRPTADGVVSGVGEGGIFNEEVRVGSSSYVLDPTVFPNAATLKQNANLGRLVVSNQSGDTDGDGDFDQIQSFGARSFSIWDASGNRVFDSGDQLEQITAAQVPSLFNSDGSFASLNFDTRSDNKGPEPEGVVVGVVNSRTYAFIGLERVGDVIVYEVTDPTKPQFVEYLNTPEDFGVEGLTFISAADSPTGKPLLVTANEISKTVAAFEFTPHVRIGDIQGASHLSPLRGQSISNVPGIVTAVAANGFYLQDPNPDADDRTSDGIFVFTSSAPTVTVGDSLQVSGTVTEFRPGNNANNLTITQISSPVISILSHGNALPAAVVLGNGGRTIPNQIISNDAASGNVENAATLFDPAEDGIDFYESLEGMRVQINNPVATSPTASFGTSEEIWVLADNGANATNRTARGGSLISASDFNPERIQIDDLINGTTALPAVDVDAQLSDIVGVVSYDFNNFEVLVSTAPTVTQPSTLQKEVTNLSGSVGQLTVATFNVENLDPADGATKFNNLAARIVTNLKSPDIISIEEVQDNNGPTNDSVVDASTTYQTLINAIAAAGGPTYQYRQIDPVDDTNGGEPGGNIRVGFLFNPSRVTFVDRPGGTATAGTTVTDVGNNGTPDLSASPGLIDPNNAAFTSSRKPLVGEFLFNGQTVYVIGNHFNSKGGDQPLFGPTQPPVLSSETQRNQQATIVADFTKSILAIDPKANIVVAGDLNDFEFSNPLSILKAAGLTPLTETLPANERYTYNFQGNAQTLDHLLVSNNLLGNLDGIDVVHINSEFADQDSDHDPSVARFNLAPKPAPFQLQILHASDFEAGIPAVDDAVRFSAVINRLRTDPNLSSSVLANTLTLSSGDNYIPGAFLNASSDTSLNGIGGLGSSTAPVIGRGDIGILNALGIQASAFGNHEFDLGVRQVRDVLRTGSGNPGTNFPYLSTNLNFQPEIAPGNPNGNLAATDLAANQTTAEASTIKGKIAKSTVITVPGSDGIAGNADDQKIGIVGATTPTLPNISSIGSIAVAPTNPIDYDALATEIQSTVDILKAQGINKIILLTHMQQLNIERDELAPRLKDVDIIIGGGSNTLLSDANNVLRAGDTKQGDYPIVKTGADGKPVLVVNTDGNYKYVGRLVTEFDDAGVLNVSKLDSSINGAYATDEAGVDRLYGADVDPRAVANPNVVAITDGIRNVISTKDNLIVGKSSVFLNGEREDVRTQETNLGNVTADANLFLAKQIDPIVTISLKNGGGIRDNIGAISAAPGAVNSDDIIKLPTQPNPLAPNKKTGDVSQLDIENSLRFNNDLSLITLTAQQLEWVLEHAVAGTRPGSTPGQFPQVSGLKFSFDPTKTAIAFNNTTGEVTTEGDRIRNLAVLNDDGSIRDVIVRDGVLVGDPNRTFRMVTLNFLAGTTSTNILGGDNYPFPKFVKDNAALANRVDLRGETIDLNGNGTVDPALALAPGKFTFAAAGSEQDAFAEYLGDRFSTTPYSIADVEAPLDTRIQRLDVRQDTVLVEPPVVDNTPTVAPVGTPGDDDLFAKPGSPFDGQNDIVFTGAGNDTVDLATVSASPRAGNNRINTGSGSDTIFANKNDRLFGGNGNDTFDATDGQGGNRMSSGAGDDLFFLGKGDRALGGDGNDKFYVQSGGDNLLSGGAGSDQFWIVNAELPSSANTVLDFQIGTDVIGFSGSAGLGISATTLKLSQVGADTAILFGNQTLATLSGIQSTELSLSNPNQFVFA